MHRVVLVCTCTAGPLDRLALRVMRKDRVLSLAGSRNSTRLSIYIYTCHLPSEQKRSILYIGTAEKHEGKIRVLTGPRPSKGKQ